jgi:hypothetical protein
MIGLSLTAAAQDAGINKELQSRLMDAMDQLEKLSKSTTGRAKFKMSKPVLKNGIRDATKVNPEVVESVTTFEISGLGDKFIKQFEVVDGIETLKVLNTEYAFVLTRLTKGRYSLVGIDQLGLGKSIVDEEIGREAAQARLNLLASYNFFAHPIWDWVRDPRFKLTKLESSSDEAGSERFFVEFSYSSQSRQPGRPVTVFDLGIERGYLIFAPQKGWKMVECSRGLHPNSTVEFSVTIQANDDHPSNQLGFYDYAVYRSYDHSKETHGEMGRFTRLESSYAPIPKEEFYLSFYGLPEPNFGLNRYWVWILGLVVAGIGCLAVSRWIRSR